MRLERLALAAMVVLGACGGADRQGTARPASGSATGARRAAPPAEAQACRLITLAEVSAITGLELKLGEKTDDYMDYSRCQWDPTSGKPTGIVLVANESGRFEDYSTVPGATPVKGLGLEAVWNPRVRQLAVRRAKGTLSVSFLSEPADRSWAEKIARTALGRLEGGSGPRRRIGAGTNGRGSPWQQTASSTRDADPEIRAAAAAARRALSDDPA
jgi:hypothetical protein